MKGMVKIIISKYEGGKSGPLETVNEHVALSAKTYKPLAFT